MKGGDLMKLEDILHSVKTCAKSNGCDSCRFKEYSESLCLGDMWECLMEKIANAYHYGEGLSPCDFCAFGPPSSGDGKPCSICPAIAKEV